MKMSPFCCSDIAAWILSAQDYLPGTPTQHSKKNKYLECTVDFLKHSLTVFLKKSSRLNCGLLLSIVPHGTQRDIIEKPKQGNLVTSFPFYRTFV